MNPCVTWWLGRWPGPILEGFVLMELARQLTWAEEQVDLYHFRTRDFLLGVVLYTGGQTLPFGDRMRAVPISALWSTAP